LYNSGKIRFTILVGYNIQKITWRPNIQHGIILITLALIAVNEIIIISFFRQAVGGLRVQSNESGIASWLEKMVTYLAWEAAFISSAQWY